MNVLLQRHCAKYIYVIPEGLRELMSDISREVLRSQPENIYNFIADYLDALMITRENARVAARFVQSITDIGITIVELLIRTGMSREEADNTAAIIQRAFKKHLADKLALQRQPSGLVEEANIITEILDEAGITPKQAEHAASIIQRSYRVFKQRQELEKDLLKGMVDWRVAARSTMRLYRKTGVTYEEANRAATLIKAAYKGYYNRRVMKRLLEKSEEISVEESKSLAAESTLGAEDGSYYKPSYEDESDAQSSFYDQFKDIEEKSLSHLSQQSQDPESIAASIMESVLKHAFSDSLATSTSRTDTELTSTTTEAPDMPNTAAEEGITPPPTEIVEPSEVSAADASETNRTDTTDVVSAVSDIPEGDTTISDVPEGDTVSNVPEGDTTVSNVPEGDTAVSDMLKEDTTEN